MTVKSKMTVTLVFRYLSWYLFSILVAWFTTVKKDRVILASNRGEGLSGNARHLFETWLKDSSFDVWVVVSSREVYQELSKKYDHILFAFSWRALKIAAQARFFILTHGRLDVPFSGFKKTIIQTWHGIPFKAIGFFRNSRINDKTRNTLYKWFDYNSIDFFLSSSTYVSKLYEGVFRQKPDKFLEIGFPRNDIFSQGRDQASKLLKPFLQDRIIRAKNIILYSPTYRPYPSAYFPFSDYAEKHQAFIDFLNSTDSVCIVKSHVNQQLELDNTLERSGRVIDVSNDSRIPDLQKIMTVVDILVTDYSSISIDALLLDLPCVFINSDIDDYVRATGDFCCDYKSLAAGAHVNTMTEMIDALNDLIDGNDAFQEKRRSAIDIFFTPSLHSSTERLLSFMKGIVKKKI